MKGAVIDRPALQLHVSPMLRQSVRVAFSVPRPNGTFHGVGKLQLSAHQFRILRTILEAGARLTGNVVIVGGPFIERGT